MIRALPWLQSLYSALDWRTTKLRYALPFVAMLTAVTLIHFVGLFDPESPYFVLLLIFSVVVTAWYGGAYPGWIAVALATIIVDFYLISPRHELSLDRKVLPWSIAFLLCAVAGNLLSLRRRHTEDVLRRTHDELDERVRLRTAQLHSAYEMLKLEISERARAETAQREAEQELARVSRTMTMDALTTSIAHEINQPLAAISTNGNAALLWLQRDPPSLDEAKASIQAMIAAANRAGAVIGQIRRLIEKGPTESEPVNLNDVVNDTLLLVGRDILSRGVALRVELEPALPKTRGSPVALQQVVLNLITNSVDSMQHVSDRPKELFIRTQTIEDDRIAAEVRDSGEGFTAQDADKLFKPFYSTKLNGVGMGLAICRTIMESLGGRIEALPLRPNGATFRIVLPIASDES